MGEYKASDFVTVADEHGVESEVPKAWLGTSLLPEGVKKTDGRRRPPAKDAAADALAEAKGAADVAVKEAADAKAALAKAEEEIAALKAAAEATAAADAANADGKK